LEKLDDNVDVSGCLEKFVRENIKSSAEDDRNSRKTGVNVHVKQPDDGHIRPKHVVKKRSINKYTRKL
jgi:hypothetical protein